MKYLRETINMLNQEQRLMDLSLQGALKYHVTSIDELYALFDCLHPDDVAVKDDIIAALAVSGMYHFRVHVDLKNTNDYTWWMLHLAVDVNEKGHAEILGIGMDINEQVAYEEEMKQAAALAIEAKQKENFLWNITHEIRTPLNAIQGFSDVVAMMGDALDPEEKKQYATEVRKAGMGLRKIINDILQFARIETDKQTYKSEQLSVDLLVSQLYKDFAPNVPEDVKYLFVNGRKDLMITADGQYIREILMQFLSNAVKFLRPAPEGKQNIITLGWMYDYTIREVQMYVEDTGIGIPTEKQEVCFDGFWKDNGFIPGIGIGLSLAKKHAENMGGYIKLFSEVGVGSRFELRIKISGGNE